MNGWMDGNNYSMLFDGQIAINILSYVMDGINNPISLDEADIK